MRNFFGKGAFVSAAWILLACFFAQGVQKTPTRSLFWAMSLETFPCVRDLAKEHPDQAWAWTEESRGGFVHLPPEAKDPQFADGHFHFATGAKAVTLGWGNYENRQAPGKRARLFSRWAEIELEVRQSADKSSWALELWSGGEPVRVPRYGPIHRSARPKASAVLKGTEWQTLRLLVNFPGADGVACSYLANMRDCTFRDMGRGLANVIMGTIYRCRFENNRRNISFHGGHTDFVLVDCSLGPTENPLTVPPMPEKKQAKQKERHQPWRFGLIEQRSVQFRIVDAKGCPVPGAVVEVHAKEKGVGEIVRAIAVSGADGLTVRDPEREGILVTSRKLLPSEDGKGTEDLIYAYTVSVRAAGYREGVVLLETWPCEQPLKVVLEPESE